MGFNQELLQILDKDLSLFGQEFRNEYGCIRWGKVRDEDFKLDVRPSLDDIVDIYKEWKDDPEYLVLRGYDSMTQEFIDSSDGWTISHDVYRFVKASKRGNDVYRYLVNKKLKPLGELDDVTFFKDNWGEKKTSLLFVTLTYDTKRCDEETAWKNIGIDYHLFYTKLRQEYGEIEYFRTWESTGHYYPHAHVLIAFKTKSFPVFIHTDKDGHRSFRIPQHDKDKIASFWHSNVDVQGVNGTKDAIDELTKYVTKDLCSEKGNKTNAMICYFRKQSYAITKGFVSLIRNSFAKVTESNDLSDVGSFDLIKDEMCNCNKAPIVWKFVGVLRGRDLKLSADIWVVDIKKPPSSLTDLIVHESLRWRKAHPDRAGAVW